MENLKRTKRTETQNKTFRMYLKLKEMPQGSCVDEDVLQHLVRNMELRKEVLDTLLGVIEVLRINAPRCFLSKEEKRRFFKLLIEVLPKEKINLETFITYRIPSLLTDKDLISKLSGLIGVVSGTAKKYLKEIIIILIEEGTEDTTREVIRSVLLHIPKDPEISSIIEVTKEISMPAVALIMENFEDKVYADVYSNLSFREHLCVRNIRGQGKLKYLTAAMTEENFEKLCNFYIGDKDKRVIKILAENCSPKHDEIFHKILSNCNEDIRATLLEKTSFKDIIEYSLDIYERILDTSHKVRAVAFNIFRSGMDLCRNLLLEIVESSEENQKNYTKAGSERECLLRLIEFILRGVFTSQRKEYIDLLNEFDLPWEFYFRIKSFKGTDVFLEQSLEKIKKEKGEPPECREKRRFYLKYFFCGELSKQKINELIRTDIQSALVYLQGKDIKEYRDLLVGRALANNSTEEVLMIVDMIKAHLKDQVWPSCPKSDAELLVYAHSKHSSIFVRQVLDFDVTFPMLYFLSYMRIPVDVLLPLLLKYKGSSKEHVEIQLGYNDKRLLQEFIEYFMEISLDEDSKIKLVRSRTFVGSMIYFVNTGYVNIKNIDFFISSIYFICTSSNNEAKVKHIYEIYSMKVDQGTFNRFYTVCLKLKGMSLNKEPYEIDDGTVLIKRNDRILFLICETVLGVREGNVVDEKFNLQAFFHPISENVQSMISSGRVV
ncbi:uncharacterized protein Eint_090200 [Encephalitozoon intestinalis ATCC 50506]|uniref:Uncharacterized protein n=1 Tax=Encephalitozoon intestinalis (strain ATCC 50506) TaxID=876142 RepID=E0S957_ENCIT|nr:uncharacterized protein Eint_090200 [Encephalitozoon intestinalis ATCC 50506]ADM12150.1 hypothetical protein Eint_090200 [Encephalitozoon intestinalis ATCC 50506]UTX45951.1 hypothetical protein GPK93_09g15360 [Encephalitozoon intestinalis]